MNKDPGNLITTYESQQVKYDVITEVGIAAGLSASTADWVQPSPPDVTRLSRDNGDTKLRQQKLEVSRSGF